MNNLPWKKIIGLFLIWRLLTLAWGLLAPQFFSYQPSFVAPESLLNYQLPIWLAKWASFDGVHYLNIAENTYRAADLIQAFFPIFPLLIRGLNLVINNYLLSGLILSNLMLLVMMFLFYGLFVPQLGEKKTGLALILLLIFPSSFFLGALYNESLFLVLVLASFYFFRAKRYWPTALLIAVASATRIVGILLVPAFLLELFWQSKSKITWRKSLIIVLGSLGLLAYMVYLWQNFNDPLYFLTVQSKFGASRQSQLILWPQVVWRYLKILFTVRPIDWKYYAYVQEFFISLLALWLLIKVAWQKILSPAWSIFALSAYFLPTLTGNFSSMPRYVIVCLPIFIYLAQVWPKTKLAKKVFYLTISLTLLIINTMLFIQGRWVA